MGWTHLPLAYDAPGASAPLPELHNECRAALLERAEFLGLTAGDISLPDAVAAETPIYPRHVNNLRTACVNLADTATFRYSNMPSGASAYWPHTISDLATLLLYNTVLSTGWIKLSARWITPYWLSGTVYALGAKVFHAAAHLHRTYTCILAHTADAGKAPPNTTYWSYSTSTTSGDIAADTPFHAEQWNQLYEAICALSTIGIPAATDAGGGLLKEGTTYANALAATPTVNTNHAYVGQSRQGGSPDWYTIGQGFLHFDTSTWPGGTLGGGKLWVNYDNVYLPTGTLKAYAVDYGGLGAGDWNIAGTLCGSVGIGSNDRYYEYDVADSLIDTGGYTQFRLSNANVEGGSPPAVDDCMPLVYTDGSDSDQSPILLLFPDWEYGPSAPLSLPP